MIWASMWTRSTIMSTMPVAQRQMVEIAKAVSYHSDVIVFDEPTSSLTEEEVEHLFRIINMLRDQRLRHHLYFPQDGGDPAYLRRSDRHARWRVGRHQSRRRK